MSQGARPAEEGLSFYTTKRVLNDGENKVSRWKTPPYHDMGPALEGALLNLLKPCTPCEDISCPGPGKCQFLIMIS